MHRPTPTPAAPATPAGLTATAGSNQVMLTWTASGDATAYSIGRAATNAGPFAAIGQTSTTSFTDTSAANGGAYFYVVSGFRRGGFERQLCAGQRHPGCAVSHTVSAVFGAGGFWRISHRHSECSKPAEMESMIWLTQQFAMPVNPSGQLSNVAWMQAYDLISVEFDTNGVQSSLWRKLISSPDVLRQRLMLALTDLLVVNTGATQLTYRGAAAAYYLDQLGSQRIRQLQRPIACGIAYTRDGSIPDLPGQCQSQSHNGYESR